MPRDRKRITDRGVPLPILSLAAAVVSNDGRTVRSVAKEYFEISNSNLRRGNLRRERNTGNSCMCRQCIREHDSTHVHIPAG